MINQDVSPLNSRSRLINYVQKPSVWMALVVIILLVFPFIVHTDYVTRVLSMACIYVMLAVGLNIVVGFTGLLDLGYVAFYGIGAYTYALLMSPQFNIHFPFWLALICSVAAATLAGIIIGGPTLRLRGDYIAIVTLGFGEITYILLINLDRPINITGGVNGILGIDPPSLFGYTVGQQLTIAGMQISSTTQFYYLFIVFAAFIIFCAYRLQHSRLGRAWVAIREDEDAAEAMGINTTITKLLSYCIGAAIGGIAGAISASWSASVYPDSFMFSESLNVLTMVILGGMGSIPGAALGAVLLTILPEIFRGFELFRFLIFGAVIIVAMIYRPQGFIGGVRRKRTNGQKPQDITQKDLACAEKKGVE